MFTRRAMLRSVFAVAAIVALGATAVLAATEAGHIKVARGTVNVQRGGLSLRATVGLTVQQGDVIVTGRDGSAGITFADDSLLSVGPNTTLAIDRFTFDQTTHQGRFQTSLKQGTLSAVSGKLARQSPDAMTVKTPVAVMAVRGTRVLVQATEIAR